MPRTRFRNRLPRLTQLDRFYPWFYRILRNRCLNFLARERVRNRYREEQLQAAREGEPVEESSPRTSLRSQALRDEYEQLRETSNHLEAISMLEPGDHVAHRLWKNPCHRMARDGGVWLILLGYGLLVGYGLFEFLTSNEPALPRFAVAAILLGSLMLLITLICDRIRQRAIDPYKDVQR